MASKGDFLVQTVQEWYNNTYKGKTGYVKISEDGIVGPGTCKALIIALQIELGLSSIDGGFGANTAKAFSKVGINENTTNKNLIRILQGGFCCKGIDCNGFDGIYGPGISSAVTVFKTHTGIGGNSEIDARHMKALLNTDPFEISGDGKAYIQKAQRYLNKYYSDNYWNSLGLIPCNGITDRNMTKALAYALQVEENGKNASGIDGIVGTNTLNKAPILSINSTKANYVKILQIAIACMYLENVDLDGIFDTKVQEAVSNFQVFMCLNQDSTVTLGTVDRKTWAAFLISKGDIRRHCDACDCSQKLSLAKAQGLKSQGYNYVGRYLTGTVGGTKDKSLSLEEIENITAAGLNIFAIYQNGGASASYFNYSKGYSDAQKAITAAKNLKIPLGEIIYFAVDYDFNAKQTETTVVSHFQGINKYFEETNFKYRIGIYGSRNICATVSEHKLACSSFISDMSTGYSGNMGYRLPDNWAFDQFYEYTFTNYPNYDGDFGVDKDVASGRYTGFNGNMKCGRENYRDITLHEMVLKNDLYCECSVCGYRVKHPVLQDFGLLSKEELLKIRTGYIFISIYSYLEAKDVIYSDMDSIKMLIDAIQRIRANYPNKYEFSDINGYCCADPILYQSDPNKLYYEYPLTYTEVTSTNCIIYDGTLSAIANAVLCIFSPNYAIYQDAQELQDILSDPANLDKFVLMKILEFFAAKATKAMGGDKALEYLLSTINLGIELTQPGEYTIIPGDYIVEYPIYQGSTFNCKNSFVVYNSALEIKAIVCNDLNS